MVLVLHVWNEILFEMKKMLKIILTHVGRHSCPISRVARYEKANARYSECWIRLWWSDEVNAGGFVPSTVGFALYHENALFSHFCDHGHFWRWIKDSWISKTLKKNSLRSILNSVKCQIGTFLYYWFLRDYGQPDGAWREGCAIIDMYRRKTSRLWHDIPCNKPIAKQFVCQDTGGATPWS